MPIRLITEPQQYREPNRLWHSWNVDRLYMSGVQIKHRAHAGLNHQKSVLLYGSGLTIFGSSNWTSPSSDSQEEHNYFTHDQTIFRLVHRAVRAQVEQCRRLYGERPVCSAAT